MAMDKGVLSETHPQFAGMYMGAASSPEVLQAVEGADLVIDAGGVSFNDINTVRLLEPYPARAADNHRRRLCADGNDIYNPVRMGDVV